jgi:hypothetical protein
MTLDASEALAWTARLAGAGIVLGTIELWQLRPVAADDGVWRWQTLRGELDALSRPLGALLGWLLRPRRFAAVLVLRAIAAVALVAGAAVPAIARVAPPLLLATQLLVQLRWRGSFNGGSDFMTLAVLCALTVAGLGGARPQVALGCVLYIAVQAATSYFLAGVAKLRRPSWRDGRAPAFFAAHTVFAAPPAPRALFASRAGALTLAWLTLAFECGFPLALLVPSLTVPWLAIGLAFHAGNAWVFGLNRFLFAWAATWPAVWYASQLHR